MQLFQGRGEYPLAKVTLAGGLELQEHSGLLGLSHRIEHEILNGSKPGNGGNERLEAKGAPEATTGADVAIGISAGFDGSSSMPPSLVAALTEVPILLLAG